MSPAHVNRRLVKTGRTLKERTRWDVKWRMGGRGFRLLHGGTFRTLGEARRRRDLIAGELAAGRDPRVLLERLQNPPPRRTLRAVYDEYIASRVDVSDSTLATLRTARDTLPDWLAEKEAARTTVADWQRWVAEFAHLAPTTIATYLAKHRLVLDYDDVDPNPARSKKLRVPSRRDEEPVPPSTGEWVAIKVNVKRRSRLLLRLVECCALRVGEACELTYGDVDFANGRIRVSGARTKRNTAGRRWIPVPQQLLDQMAARVPLEDRQRNTKVFEGLSQWTVRKDLTLACRDAEILHYHPHDLRHRRVSLWIAHGFDLVTVKTWSGHSRASVSSDVYGHVIVPGEDEWRAFWVDAYATERLYRPVVADPGDPPVIHGEGVSP